MSTAASSDLPVQASVTENTPGGKLCQDLASMYRTFPACGFAICVQAQLVVQPLLSSGTPYPDKPLSSSLESPETCSGNHLVSVKSPKDEALWH